MSEASPVVYTIEFVCSECGKKAPGEKEMFKDPSTPPGWRTIQASSAGHSGNLIYVLFCLVCAPLKMTEIALMTMERGHEINIQLRALVR